MKSIISLAGQWNFKLDKDNKGIEEKWFDGILSEKIKLPGSTDEAGYGGKTNEKDPHRLSRVYEYIGAAWYQKEVFISEEFKDKSIVLFLERCHIETRVWVDGKEAGMQDSLCVAHNYDVSSFMTPGNHILTIRVDNTVKYDVGVNAHSVTKETQTNWNGVIGKIQLEAYDKVRIADVQVYPDIERATAKVIVSLQNDSNEAVRGKLSLNASTWNTKMLQSLSELEVSFDFQDKSKVIEVEYEIGSKMQLWDEFSPAMYKLTACIDGETDSCKFKHSNSVDFGMREFKALGLQFMINGRPTFLRGTLECCVFPLTGYPPTDVESWNKLFKIAKDYGLNHIRFHSWCPPEAAFTAADTAGLMLQIETPVWTVLGEDPEVDEFIYKEGERILRAYGNHPSFCMMAVGNEPSGENMNKFLSKIVSYWRNKDSRRLYTGCAGWPEVSENDYHCIKNRKEVLRAQDWLANLSGRLNAKPLTTDFDYNEQIADCAVPVVSHEIGQWCSYPNFKEMDKYTGVLEPRNFEIIKDSLIQKGMFEQAEDFLKGSGKLQTLLYKEDIEAALRTKGFGGFQLLGLTDFPGQGTALVGMLDTFWESKGYVDETEFNRFCCETVPLLRMSKVVWTNNETFKGSIEIANFGASPIEGAIVVWQIENKNGNKVAYGESAPVSLPVGNGIKVSNIELKLNAIDESSELIVTVAIKGTKYSNSWSIWVYTDKLDLTVPKEIVMTQSLEETISELRQGKKVLFMPVMDQFISNDIPAGFTTIFWNTAWTRGQKPHTLGVLCNPENPALKNFTTDFHTNWQWFDLITKSKFMVLDGLNAGFKPIVQIIDDWNKNRKLGLLLEGRVGHGELLMCSIDLNSNIDERPVARQFLYNLFRYMESVDFSPKNHIEIEQLKAIFL
ncbi:glycoside hydrolase family 2 [Clostridium swellfunianum]|uniref:sugar-binding domain-containing protein n=1 Tax=Clostridium swellfunianum TaxID=1367462 RepID=UPI0020305DB2|nr:sugar-binding domain-containing protein [Clostridium swellfunianum]MCM0649356.1 glycoside hydrolase family 2 [Clostridium swellfunianum]